MLVLEVRGVIDPAMARYVARGLEEGRRARASAVVLELDTPGGLDGSLRRIAGALLDSPVPVIAYVVPSEAGRVSAGVLLAGSAQIAGGVPAARPPDPFLAAGSMEDLLQQAEGRQVKTPLGTAVLALRGQPRRRFPLSPMENVLHQLAHPNFSYLLLLLGIYGLVYELAKPGAVFPGVLGAILLVGVLIALETLEVYWGGIALIALAVLLFIAGIRLPRARVWAAGAGAVLFALGSALLFPGGRIPSLCLHWSAIGSATLLTTAFFLAVVGAGKR